MQNTRYVGIDLAWGARNTTAVVVLAGDGDPRNGAALLAAADALLTDDDILEFVAACVGPKDSVIVAIDAPTIVPNETGRRPCEAILSRCLHRQQGGPHPANRRLLGGKSGAVPRGERLVSGLAGLGIPETPYLDGLTLPVRACFEAFPHPAHLALFGLEKTLKYKTKPRRTRELCISEFRRYADFLTALVRADPPLLLPPDEPNPWWTRDPAQLTPAVVLKRHEDALDALTCAYIALYRHRWGDERSVVVGDLTHGYIVTPATDAMRVCFEAAAAGVAAAVAAASIVSAPLTPGEPVV